MNENTAKQAASASSPVAHLTIHRDQLLSAAKFCRKKDTGDMRSFLQFVEVHQIKDGIRLVASDGSRAILSTDDSGDGVFSKTVRSASIEANKLSSRLRGLTGHVRTKGPYVKIPLQKLHGQWVFCADPSEIHANLGGLKEHDEKLSDRAARNQKEIYPRVRIPDRCPPAGFPRHECPPRVDGCWPEIDAGYPVLRRPRKKARGIGGDRLVELYVVSEVQPS